MFNFFDEIKNKVSFKEDVLNDYNIVNISGKIVYIEGHKGLLILSEKNVVCKLKRGQIEVCGSGLYLAELSENTILIQGKIERVESR